MNLSFKNESTLKRRREMLVGWLFCFTSYQPFSGHLMLNYAQSAGGYRIHQLQLCREVRPHSHIECPAYDTEQSDSKVPVMLELWGMWSTPLLP